MQYLYVDIRKMEERDLPSVMEIENLCFKDPWQEKDFLYEMKENQFSNLWVIELSHDDIHKSVVGFSDYWQTFDSATICQIAVHPEIQRRQMGTALMDEIINDCIAKKVRTLTLEVRKSNAKARSFYLKQGFKEVVIKPKYYKDGEDAIYMSFEVDKDA